MALKTSPPVIVLLTSGHPKAPAVLELLRANGVVVKAVVHQGLVLLPPRWKDAGHLRAWAASSEATQR